MRSEREYIGVLEAHTEAMAVHMVEIAEEHNEDFALELMETWGEYLQARDVITDEMVEMLPILDEYR